MTTLDIELNGRTETERDIELKKTLRIAKRVLNRNSMEIIKNDDAILSEIDISSVPYGNTNSFYNHFLKLAKEYYSKNKPPNRLELSDWKKVSTKFQRDPKTTKFFKDAKKIIESKTKFRACIKFFGRP